MRADLSVLSQKLLSICLVWLVGCLAVSASRCFRVTFEDRNMAKDFEECGVKTWKRNETEFGSIEGYF